MMCATATSGGADAIATIHSGCACSSGAALIWMSLTASASATNAGTITVTCRPRTGAKPLPSSADGVGAARKNTTWTACRPNATGADSSRSRGHFVVPGADHGPDRSRVWRAGAWDQGRGEQRSEARVLSGCRPAGMESVVPNLQHGHAPATTPIQAGSPVLRAAFLARG